MLMFSINLEFHPAVNLAYWRTYYDKMTYFTSSRKLGLIDLWVLLILFILCVITLLINVHE